MEDKFILLFLAKTTQKSDNVACIDDIRDRAWRINRINKINNIHRINNGLINKFYSILLILIIVLICQAL